MAELSLICPKCKSAVSVPIEEDADEYTCTACGERSRIQQTLDEFTSAVDDPLIGAVISECEVEAKVGEGGFGAVYRAFDRNLQRHVALKVMLQSLTSNLEFVQKFIREAITAAQLNHPNIVAIHKVGRDEDRNVHFLIMEFLEGRTLADVIEEKGSIPLDEAISVILQCADALAVAHDKRIIHRDIKPENIMIDRHGVVKITDFGLAKTVTTDMKSTKVVGTPHYMSPEQFEGKAVDGRTDIYSLGITFYFMLSRAKPYEGTNTVQIIYSILTQEPRSITELNPDIPEEIWRVIKKMIAKGLDDRYPDFREVRRDLLAFQERSLAQKVTCPQCQAVNVRGRKFCRECGASLFIQCPECGHEDMAGTRHCGQCGIHIEGLLKIRENIERGEKLRGFGDLKRALAFYEEALKIDPEHEEATRATREIRQELTRIDEKKAEIDDLVKQGDADQALSAVEELLSKFPRVEEVKTYGQTVRRSLRLRAVDAHLLVAEKALADGRLEDALAAYGKALGVDPERSDIREKQEDLRRRIATFEQTLEKAETALSKGRHLDALNAAQELLRLKPDHERARAIHSEAKAKVESIESFVAEAKRLLESKAYAEALDRLETAAEISPADEEVAALADAARRGKAEIEEKLSLVRRLLAEDRPEEALAGIDELLAAKPDLPAAVSLRSEAERDLETKRHAEEIEALLAKGQDFERAGDFERALAVFMEVLERDPENEVAEKARARAESRMEEVGRLENLADEHLAAGAFAQAVAALNQLRELLPEDEVLAARTEDARQKMERVDASLRRAADALKRKRFDLATKAADEVLAVAPENRQARSARRDAERGQAAVEKHLEEARSLIGSELFDDAIAELNKALEKGAPPPTVAQLRQAADEGKMMLLKSEATRSFVFKDFAAAIERYEQVLAVESDDPDARKGMRLAEKMIRAREREGVLAKVLATVIVLAGLFGVQYAAMGVGSRKDIKSDQDRVLVTEEPPPSTSQLVKIEEGAGVAAADWTQIGASYEKFLVKHKVDEIRDGLAFSKAMATALSVPISEPERRLEALRAAEKQVGGVLPLAKPRKERIEAAIDETVTRWLQRTYDSEGSDWQAAVENYDKIKRDPSVRGTPLEQVVENEYRQFALGVEAASELLQGKDKDYGLAHQNLRTLKEGVTGTDARSVGRKEKLDGEIKKIRAAWIAGAKRRYQNLKDDPGATAEKLDDLLSDLADMTRELGEKKATIFGLITGE